MWEYRDPHNIRTFWKLKDQNEQTQKSTGTKIIFKQTNKKYGLNDDWTNCLKFPICMVYY